MITFPQTVSSNQSLSQDIKSSDGMTIDDGDDNYLIIYDLQLIEVLVFS